MPVWLPTVLAALASGLLGGVIGPLLRGLLLDRPHNAAAEELAREGIELERLKAVLEEADHWRETVRDLRAEIDELRRKLNKAELVAAQDLADLRGEYDKRLTDEHDGCETRLRAKDAEIAELQDKIQHLQGRVHELEVALGTATP